MNFYILFIAFIFFLIYFLINRQFSYWKRMGVKFEPPSIPYGNLSGISNKFHQCQIHQKIYEKFKGSGDPFTGFFAYLQPVVLVTNLDFLRTVFVRDSANFIDRGAYYNERDNPISAHLFNLDNPKWKILRTKLTPTFTSGKMKFMFDTVVDVAEKFVKKLESEAKIALNNELEIKEYAGRFTTDVIGSVGFGLDINSLDDPNTEFRVQGKKPFETPKYSATMNLFFISFKKLSRALKYSAIASEVEDFFIRIVRETIEKREANEIARNDFMHLLIQLKNHGKLEDDTRMVGKLSLNEIAAQCFIFFAAGYETSSTAMSYALFELAQNQALQDKARNNVMQVLKRFDGKITYEALNEMDYLGNCVNESLRKYPPVSTLARYSNEDYKVESTGFVIKKGQVVIIPTYAIHHDAEIFPNPEVYDPDRFTPEETAKRNPYAFMPFGHGPRNCIGLRFGVMQAKIGLALLLKNFKFEPCKKTINKITFRKNTTIMLLPENGIHLKITKI